MGHRPSHSCTLHGWTGSRRDTEYTSDVTSPTSTISSHLCTVTSEELSGETYNVEGPIPIIPCGGSAYRHVANSDQIPKSVSALGPRGDDQYSCRPVSRKCNKGQGHPSLGRSLPARPRLVIILRVPLGQPDFTPLAGTPRGRPNFNKGQR